jgi:hypothetical protein
VATDDAEPLRPAEFCALERNLVAAMAMRKKRNIKMDAAQQLKLQLLDQVAVADPEPALFSAALADAVITISGGPGTGPAQAVASDLQMDWNLAQISPGFVTWLRRSGTDPTELSPPPSGERREGAGGR